MTQDATRRLADAVLLEGYVLYPYRASSAKNQFRWAFGVVAPKGWSEAGGCEPWWCETQCLVVPKGPGPLSLSGALRFIQARARRVEAKTEGGFVEVAALEVDGVRHQPFDEGAIREAPFRTTIQPGQAAGGRQPGTLDLWERSPDRDGHGARSDTAPRATPASAPTEHPFTFKSGEETEPLGPDGATGRLIRTHWEIRGRIQITADPLPAEHPLYRVRIRLENLTQSLPSGAGREEALRTSCIAAHLILELEGGAFLSLLDPPGWAESAAKACRNTRIYPVLAGPEGDDRVLLASPIILYDHPTLAPESPGDFFDACEIDELLVLRTATLTEDEKRQARGTDPRSAAILDRVERLSPEKMGQLHGALRDLHRGEMIPRTSVNGIGPGSRVRLRPGARRTDAQDLLFEGRVATVDKLRLDVDGTTYVAVTMDGDPAAELHQWYGRFLYYRLDEVELLSQEEAECPAS